MRQIKFRAFRKDTKQMFDDIKFCDFNGEKIVHEQGLNEAIGIAQDTFFELMQFTGLLDKNGKEIYEGDVVEVFNRGNWVVEFIAGSFQMRKFNHNYPRNKSWVSLTTYSGGTEDGGVTVSNEVIGNIYETPNLLN